MESSIDLGIIVLNYRTLDYTIGCLRSLATERSAGAPTLAVVLLDNASGDASIPLIREAIREHDWERWIDFLPMERNLGFAGGNNAGIRRIVSTPNPPGYLLFLNSDTVVHPGCLRASVERMRREPDIGVLSCMLRNRDGSVQNVCYRHPSPIRETVRILGFPYVFRRTFAWADLEDRAGACECATRDVDWVGGAFMLVPTALLGEIGGFDESFFFYGEDIELCHRARRHGYRVCFDPTGSITHFGGASSDPSHLADIHRRTLRWRARLRVQRVCHGPVAAAWLRALSIALVWIRLAIFTLRGRLTSAEGLGAVEELDILRHRMKEAA